MAQKLCNVGIPTQTYYKTKGFKDPVLCCKVHCTGETTEDNKWDFGVSALNICYIFQLKNHYFMLGYWVCYVYTYWSGRAVVSMPGSQLRGLWFESLTRWWQFGLIFFHARTPVHLSEYRYRPKSRSFDLALRQKWEANNPASYICVC